jgi:hypothetical protein
MAPGTLHAPRSGHCDTGEIMANPQVEVPETGKNSYYQRNFRYGLPFLLNFHEAHIRY